MSPLATQTPQQSWRVQDLPLLPLSRPTISMSMVASTDCIRLWLLLLLLLLRGSPCATRGAPLLFLFFLGVLKKRGTNPTGISTCFQGALSPAQNRGALLVAHYGILSSQVMSQVMNKL